MWVIALLVFVWSFTTGTTEAAGPQSVDLGTSGNFAILAKTGVSTTGTTAVVGNIGLILISRQTLKYSPMESCQRLNDFFVI